jgi:hypothetical protein
MAGWDNHKVRMLACLQVLLIMLLHMEGKQQKVGMLNYKNDKEA